MHRPAQGSGRKPLGTWLPGRAGILAEASGDGGRGPLLTQLCHCGQLLWVYFPGLCEEANTR